MFDLASALSAALSLAVTSTGFCWGGCTAGFAGCDCGLVTGGGVMGFGGVVVFDEGFVAGGFAGSLCCGAGLLFVAGAGFCVCTSTRSTTTGSDGFAVAPPLSAAASVALSTFFAAASNAVRT